MKNDAKLEEELTCRFKIGMRNLTILHSSNHKNLYFNGLLLNKLYNVWAKNVQRSYVSWHWRVTQNLKKNWHVIWKTIQEISKILPEHSKDSNKDFDGILLSKTENEYAYREVMYMTINNDTKNEEELTCRFKIDMKNVANFRPSTRKFQKFAL